MVSFADEVASLTAEDEAMSARLEGVREENRRVSRSKRERQKELETLLGVREAVFGRFTPLLLPSFRTPHTACSAHASTQPLGM